MNIYKRKKLIAALFIKARNLNNIKLQGNIYIMKYCSVEKEHTQQDEYTPQ
jgi:hypothetical protein